MIRSTTTVLMTVLLFAATPAAAEINEDPGDGDGGGTGGGEEEPPPPVPGYWKKEFTQRDYWGTYGWGAGYTIGGKLSATPKQTINGKDKLTVSAYAKATASINANTKTLLEVRLTGLTEAKGRTDLTLTGYAGGMALFSRPFVSISSTKSTVAMTPIDWPATFVDLSTTVSVGPVPVTFRAQATGVIKATLTGQISNAGVEVTANPQGKASLYASGAIGGQYCYQSLCVGASAGLYVDVTLVEIAAPAFAKIWWSLAQSSVGVLINFDLDADLNLKTLDGELGLFAEACLGGCHRWDVSLIDWDGFTASLSLFDQYGYYCLSGTCTSPIPLPMPRGVQ